MLRSRALAVVLSLVTVVLGAGVVVSSSAQAPESFRGQGPVVPPGLRDRAVRDGRVRVIVELRPGVRATQAEARLSRQGGAQAVLNQRQSIAAARGRVLARLQALSARETRRFETLPYLALELGASELDALATAPDVLRVLPDDILRPSLATSIPRIEVDQVWQAGFDGTGTAIAILDSGVDAGHPFFGGRVTAEACFSSTLAGVSRSVCPNGEASQIGAGAAAPCELGDCLHGTHVAGIAAGSGATSGQSFSGVAKGASLVAVQVFSEVLDDTLCGGSAPCLGGFTADLLAALEHVYALKVGGLNLAAVNMSLGGGSFAAPCDDQPFKPAIDHLREAGVATIVASGNNAEPESLSTPACVSSAVSVGATTIGDDVAWFSNVSPFLSLLAPGEDIVSSMPEGGYAALSGTSMAAPHVAGAWALIRQAKPSASVDDVLYKLRMTGLPVTDTRLWAPGTTTVPRVRVFRALAALKSIDNPMPVLSSVSPATGRQGIALTLTLTGSGFNAFSKVRWNGEKIASVTDSTTKITASVPASLMALGTSMVKVINPSPGGGVSAALPVEVLPPPTLTVDKTVVAPGEDVTVTLVNGFGNQLDWLAMAAIAAPDTSYMQATFVGQGVTSRTWTVRAPTAGGHYEFRLFLNNGHERAATSPKFTVDTSISPVPVVTSMTPTDAIAGFSSSPVTLTIHGSSFVSSSVAHWNGLARPTTFVSSTQLRATISVGDLSAAGVFPVTVVTPSPGGGTSSALNFTVRPAPVLTVSATSITAGQSVTVTLANGLGGQLDFLTFALQSSPDNAYTSHTYVGAGVTSRTWTVTPTVAGTYEFRLFREGQFIRAATSPAVTVNALPPPVLTVSSTSVAGGEPVTVTLTNGEGGQLDWLSFAATGAADSSYLQFVYVGAGVTSRTWTVTAPNTTGTFEFRLYRHGSFVRIATSPTVSVTGPPPPPPPPPSLTVNQTSVAPGGSVTVTLSNGPGGASDFLALAATTSADAVFLQSIPVGDGVTSTTWTVAMPTTPGTYEFRLFVGATPTRAATSPAVTVQASTTPQLTVSATTVVGGSPVTVTLTNGLGGSQDWLAFARVGSANSSYVQFTYVGAGVTTRTWTVTTPTTPGMYEFRLFRQGSFVRLATSEPVSVEAPPPPTLTVSATSVAPGQTVTVTLTNGLGGGTDWLAFARVGSAAGSYVTWTYVGAGVTTRTWTVTAPSTPGTYEFRLFRQGSFVLVATSPPVQVGSTGTQEPSSKF